MNSRESLLLNHTVKVRPAVTYTGNAKGKLARFGNVKVTANPKAYMLLGWTGAVLVL